ncbi:MATE family efflux transporter [uncultured Negativibacillus sp.]|uniref:MATE family efflux transporter n=1 Tax=uncultured Negativibacillus sp. TaxID=1980696 RepID=UPI0025D6CDFA|nr:MATE family efflux transporter [uncultured Negativibacillus sp.]
MRKQNDLGKDDIKQLVRRLAIPSMLAQFVNVLYSIVDRMYIGNIPEVGEVALAGAGVCGPIVTLISSFAFLVGIGGAPLMAIRMGEENQEGAEKILANCFVMLLGLSAMLTGAAIAFREPMLMFFGASEQTFPYAYDYLTFYVTGTVFAILTAGLNQFITCQGFANEAMLTTIIGAVMNIVLDPIFIFVLGMGVRGAAVATVLSQACSCAFVLWFLFGYRAHVRITLGGYSARVMLRVLTFGFCPFIIIAGDSVLIIALNTVLQRYGENGSGDMLIACATIVQSYMQIVTLPLGGITSGTQPILSFNYGAKNTDRIRKGEKEIVKLAFLFCLIMFIISQTVSSVFVRLFTQNEQYIQLSVWAIKVFTFGIIPLALQYAFVDGLTALGIVRVSVSLSVFRKVAFLVLTLLIPAYFGATAAFYAEPIVDIFCGLFSTAIFLSLIGRILRKREQMPDGQSLYS